MTRRLPAPLIGRIELFGSTAVPGSAAKPIIGLLVEVSSSAEAGERIAPLLESEGYDYFRRTDVEPAYAWFIRRDGAGRRTHHVHMVEQDSGLWERLLFRDYLREFPDEARRYEELKLSLSGRHPNDRIAYTEGKAEYVRSTTERARRLYGAT